MIIGVDRLDYSKGIASADAGLRALPATQSGWHGKVTYLQITPKKSHRDQRISRNGTEQLVSRGGRINGTYGEAVVDADPLCQSFL